MAQSIMAMASPSPRLGRADCGTHRARFAVAVMI
jgi:hypothetical protein